MSLAPKPKSKNEQKEMLRKQSSRIHHKVHAILLTYEVALFGSLVVSSLVQGPLEPLEGLPLVAYLYKYKHTTEYAPVIDEVTKFCKQY